MTFSKLHLKLELKHYVITMILVAICFIAVVYYFFNSFFSNAQKYVIAKNNAELLITSSRIEDFFLHIKNLVDISASTVDYMMTNGANNNDIEKFFYTQSIVYKKTLNRSYIAMYGFFNGAYVDGTRWIPPANYNPKERPWYRIPMQTPGKTVIIPPYLDLDTHKTIISCAKTMQNGIGVIAFDCNLDEIENFSNALCDKFGFAFILDNNGNIVSSKTCSANDNCDLSARFGKIIHQLVPYAMQSSDGSHLMTVDGNECIVFTKVTSSGWRVVIVRNQDEIFNSVKKSFQYGLATVIGIICVIWLFLIVSFKNLNQERNSAISAEKAKSYFFATVSHDIRTPLNSIIGFSELLKLGIDNPKLANEYLEHIIFSGNILMLLINDILDLAKLDAGKMQYSYDFCDFAVSVKNVLLSFGHVEKKSDWIFKCVIPDGLPKIRIDEQRMRQILFNLIGNAVKFTKSGEITVHVSFVPEEDNRGTLNISVQDTGVGIAEQDIEKLRKPFAQLNSKSQGTGLGLSICNAMLKQMGGKLSIASKLGVGSTFSVTLRNVEFSNITQVLPLTQREISSTTNAVNFRERSFSLLLVDDVVLNLKVLKALFQKAGLSDCIAVNSGQAALDMLHTRSFDAVLTDVWMPKMNGDELLAQIRKDPKTEKLPVYAITADVEKTNDYKKLGYTGLLLKPITLARILDLLQELDQVAKN